MSAGIQPHEPFAVSNITVPSAEEYKLQYVHIIIFMHPSSRVVIGQLNITIPVGDKVLVETYSTTNTFMIVDDCVMNIQYVHQNVLGDKYDYKSDLRFPELRPLNSPYLAH
jgi:hypothetical protein